MQDLNLKKSLGQHFLKDEGVLRQIADAIGNLQAYKTVVEIGPGMGALTKYLVKDKPDNFFVVELDDRWVEYLPQTYPHLKDRVIHKDFLALDLSFLQNPAHLVGNFPYNISSQIVFKMIDHREVIEAMTGMFQKEVAKRIISKPGTKDYGVMSVLTQAYYEGKYLFDVVPEAFNPPPKVMSGVIQLKRKANQTLGCDEKLFKLIVKTAFNQRRKTMRNSLKGLVNDKAITGDKVFELRPEQLSVEQFVQLTQMLS